MNLRSTAVPATAVFTIVGILAYATGTSKEWILSPIGDWFGDLLPDQKVLVVAALVIVIIAMITWSRLQRRNRVTQAHRAVSDTIGVRQ